jgi:CheY-like chemotaxis protein
MTQTKRVALIDDNPEFLTMLNDQLCQAGYTVIPIPLHQNVFQQIKNDHPDVIICDLLLDNITAGWALVDMLYLDPATRPIPLILCAMTSQSLQEASASFAGKGILWIEKPFKIETLLDVLAGVDDNPYLQLLKKPIGSTPFNRD